jgi:hypothetical protein
LAGFWAEFSGLGTWKISPLPYPDLGDRKEKKKKTLRNKNFPFIDLLQGRPKMMGGGRKFPKQI